jgi:riboflavin biosynthesis pyrimidine reductase
VTSFDDYCRRKEAMAAAAVMPPYRTVTDATDDRLVPIGNTWSAALFDGPFYRTASTSARDTPVTSLVFVQSRDGNTVASDPSTLGGGETDKHLIYEGLSRVDADAVLAGAATARDPELVFSVWHPQLVALRRARGRDRHPAQVIVTNTGTLPFDGLMFTSPELRVFVISSTTGAEVARRAVAQRAQVEVIDAGNPLSITHALRQLRNRGIATISCVGGRHTATTLLREGLVSDLYLTTSAISAGEPGTPFYEGPPLALTKVVEKAGQGPEEGVRFEHLVLISPEDRYSVVEPGAWIGIR